MCSETKTQGVHETGALPMFVSGAFLLGVILNTIFFIIVTRLNFHIEYGATAMLIISLAVLMCGSRSEEKGTIKNVVFLIGLLGALSAFLVLVVEVFYNTVFYERWLAMGIVILVSGILIGRTFWQNQEVARIITKKPLLWMCIVILLMSLPMICYTIIKQSLVLSKILPVPQ